jgi:hypothetical protein
VHVNSQSCQDVSSLTANWVEQFSLCPL